MLAAALSAQYIGPYHTCGYLAMLIKSKNATNGTWKIKTKEN